MKLKNYEKTTFFILFFLFLLLFASFLVSFLYHVKIGKYLILNGTVLKENTVYMVVSYDERKVIYKNSNLFIHDLEMRYKIVEDRGVILEKDHKKYYELWVEFPFDEKYREEEILNLSFKNGNITIMDAIKSVWR